MPEKNEKTYRVLVVDDEELECHMLKESLATAGYEIHAAPSGEEAIEKVAAVEFDAVILDLRLPGIDGLEALRRIKGLDSRVEVIMLTGHGTIDSAVTAMQDGAYNYLIKPCDLDELALQLARACERRDLQHSREVMQTTRQVTNQVSIIGESPDLLKILDDASRIAKSNSPCLIVGESGTGKELVARYIHEESPRRDEILLALNCANFSENLLASELFGHEKGAFTGAYQDKPGLIECARRGTLFLDEIGDMPLRVQGKLLRVLESGEYRRVGGERSLRADVRVISATNCDLAKAVEEGRFRRDLFYRINVVTLRLPPLRQRGGDVILLARHFLRHYAAKHRKDISGFAENTLGYLEAYDWPGSVRELEHVIERGVILATGNKFTESLLPRELVADTAEHTTPRWGTIEAMERQMIEETLAKNNWNREQSAQELGISVKTLYRKIKNYNLAPRSEH